MNDNTDIVAKIENNNRMKNHTTNPVHFSRKNINKKLTKIAMANEANITFSEFLISLID